MKRHGVNAKNISVEEIAETEQVRRMLNLSWATILSQEPCQ